MRTFFSFSKWDIAKGLLTLLFLLAFPATMKAQYEYTVDNGAVTIAYYTGSDTEVVIPGLIEGMPVKAIGEQAFSQSSVISVTIPNSVTIIGQRAFDSCGSLANVTIGNGVTTIETRAFSNCRLLTDVMIGNSVTNIGDVAFAGCIGLTNISLPDSVTRIGEYAFAGCLKLSKLTIGNGVVNIGGAAFKRCTSLGNVRIPDSVVSIGNFWEVLDENGAFYGCTSLTNVNMGNGVVSIGKWTFARSALRDIAIPSGVTNIAWNAFDGCDDFRSFTVEPLNPVYGSLEGVLLDHGQRTIIQYPEGRAGNYRIPVSVTSIGSGAFGGRRHLSSVILPGSVTHIGDYAFAPCTSLTGVYFEGDAPSAGVDVFGDYNYGPSGAIIYRLPGTSGWNPMFEGHPTLLWHPQIVLADGSFRTWGDSFGFTITWATDRVVFVEACGDLGNPVWTPVGTNTLTEGSSYFSDPQWTNYSIRIYRLRSP